MLEYAKSTNEVFAEDRTHLLAALFYFTLHWFFERSRVSEAQISS
jgi:hypothetical protein